MAKASDFLQEQGTFKASDIVNSANAEHRASSLLGDAPVEGDMGLYDATIGQVIGGSAETAGLLARGVDRSFVAPTVGSSDYLVQFGKEMDDFVRSHPEYSPQEVSSASDLVTNPIALTSRVFHGAPMLAATIASSEFGGVVPTAALLYTTEAQRGYEDAIHAGAAPDRAEAAGRQMGMVNAAIQILTQQRLLKFARGDEGAFAREVARQAGKLSTAGNLAADLTGEATMAAFYGSLQGAVDEGIALYQYNKRPEGTFLDRRLQDAVGGATAGVVFGLVGKAGRKIFQDFVQTDPATGKETTQKVELNVYDRDSFANHLVKEYGMEPDRAAPVAEVVDAFARSWGDRNQQPVEKFYGQYVDQNNVTPETKSNGDAIAKDVENVPKLFLAKEPETVIKSLVDIATAKISPNDEAIYQKSLGSADPDTVSRHLFDYLKSGEAPAPELVEPFESLKQTFKDVWFTTKDEVYYHGTNVDFTNFDLSKSENPGLAEGVSVTKNKALADEYANLRATDRGGTGRVIEARFQGKLFDADTQKISLNQVKEVLTPQEIKKLGREGFDLNKEINYQDLASSVGTKTITNVLTKLGFDGISINKGQEVNVFDPAKLIPKSDTPLPVKGVFDSLFSVDTDQIKEARAKLEAKALERDTLEATARAKNPDATDEQIRQPSTTVVTTPDQMGVVEKTIESPVVAADRAVEDLSLDLKRLQLGREIPDRDSAVARRAALDGTAREVLRSGTTTDRVNITRFTRAIDFFRAAYDENVTARRFSWGRKLFDLIGMVKNQQGVLEGQFANSNWEVYDRLSLRDKLWLNFVDETEAEKTGVRMSNFQRFIDLAGVPNPISEAPNPALQAYREQVRNINTTFGRLAEADATTFKLKDGTIVNYKQPELLRMIRHLTPDARQAIETKQGPVWETLRDTLLAAHEGLKLGDVHSALDDAVKGQGISTSGPLTESRVLKTMPTEVKLPNGQIVQILQTHPYHYLQSATRVQAYQIAWNKIIRQDHLDPVGKKDIKALAEQLGVAPVFGVKDLVSMIEAKTGPGTVPEAMMQDPKALKKMIKTLDPKAEVGPTKKAYKQALDKLNPVDLTESQVNTLKFFAKKVGGVDPEQHPIGLLSELRNRLSEKPVDIIKTVTENFVKEGGDPALLTNIIKQSQGIPTHLPYLELNPVYRSYKFVANILGTAHTSLSVLLNIPQTLVQVLPAVGYRNFTKAIERALHDYRGTRDAQVALGAIQNTHLAWMFEKGRTLEGIGKAVQQALYYGTGMKFIADVNNVVAGEAFRLKSKDWQKGKYGGKDENLTRLLRLTSEDINYIKSGEFGTPGQKTDLLHAKIVQNGVARTQFVTESAHNRGYLENNPLTSLLFNYNNYTLGTTRILGDYVRGWKDAVTSKNPAKAANMMYRTALMVGGGLGADAVGQMLRSVIRGDASHDDTDTTKDRVIGGVAALTLLGPTTRVLQATKYDQGSLDAAFLGLMPQVKAVVNGFGLLANMTGSKYGRYGKMSTAEQAKQLALQNTPLAKSIDTWMENVAYPDVIKYREARANVSAWLKTKGVEPEPGIQQVNPEYDKVFEWVKRGEQDKAVQAATEYYQNYVEKMQKLATSDPEQLQVQGLSIQRAREGLRSSLQSRAPIHADARMVTSYVSQLSPQKRDEYLMANAKYMQLVNLVAPRNE